MGVTKTTRALTAKRERFCQEIAKGKSMSDAYREAFSCQKMKGETIHKRASELMADGEVTGRISALAALVEREVVVEIADLLREASRIAFSDIRAIINDKGQVKLPHELDADTGRAVKSFKIDEYGRIEYQFWDKNSAIERLFKHKGLFELDNGQKTLVVPTRIELVPLTSGEAGESASQSESQGEEGNARADRLARGTAPRWRGG